MGRPIPSIQGVQDQKTADILRAMRDALNELMGYNNVSNRALLLGEMKNAGIVATSTAGAIYDPDTAEGVAFSSVNFEQPDPPSSLAAQVAENIVILTWAKPAFKGQLWTEIWELRAPAFLDSVDYAIDDFVTYGGTVYKFTSVHSAAPWDAADVSAAGAGDLVSTNAEVVDMGLGTSLVHTLGLNSISYFWARTITEGKVASAFNSATGVKAQALALSGLAPIGAELMSQASPGSEWVEADGSTYNKADYPELWSWINTNGLDTGSTAANYASAALTFTVPDYRGRVLIGKASAGTFSTIGAIGGAETHTLATGEIPAHNHTITDAGHTHTVTDPGHTHGEHVSATGGTGSALNADATGTNATASATTGITVDSATTGITVDNAGGGGAHNNLQPYAVTRVWIRAQN